MMVEKENTLITSNKSGKCELYSPINFIFNDLYTHLKTHET